MSPQNKVYELLKKLIDDEQEIRDFNRTVASTLLSGLVIGFNLGRDQISAQAITEAFLLDFPAARRVLKRISLKAARKALRTTKSDLVKVISNSIQEGHGAQQLAAALSDKYELKYLSSRSLLIARTEGTGVLNAGTMLQMEEDDQKFKKWRATLGDGRTRQTHIDVHISSHERPIPIEKKFRVGASYGMYPSDQNLDIKERANCRCALVNATFDEIRCRHYDVMFLREHGSYERRLQQAVNVYFKRMKDRILDRVHSLDTLQPL